MTLLNPPDFEKIDAYLDDQMGTEERHTFEARLAREPALAAALAAERRLRANLRDRLQKNDAPASLRANVQAALAELPSPPAWRQRLLVWLAAPRPVKPYVAIVYTLLLVLVSGGLVVWFNRLSAPPEEPSIFDELASQHAIYLGANAVLDVRDRPAEVEAWFQGRVPFRVFIPVLSGWNLEGGRQGEIHQAGAAYLLYGRAGRHLSFLIFSPRAADFSGTPSAHAGDTDYFIGSDGQRIVILWRKGDIGYALVGDPGLSAADLLSLATTIEKQLDQQSP